MNKILALTDDAADVRALRHVLQQETNSAFTIAFEDSSAAAITRLQAGDIDAVLADLALAGANGIQLFEQLQAAALHIPIMILAANDDDPLAIEAVRRGAQGYLSKQYLSSYLVAQGLRNVIQHKAVEQAHYIEKTRAEIALNSISDAVLCTDLLGNVEYLNIAGEQITGWSREEARGQPIGQVFNLINGITREPACNPVRLVLQQNQPMGLNADTVLIRRDGSEAPIEDSTSPIHDWDGQLTGVVIVFHDVSANQAMTIKMAHLAQHDFLTNLPNRVLLNDRIAQGITLAKRRNAQLAVLFLDLDNFKHINDSLGHETGDKLLQSVAQRLTSCVRDSDTVSRQGGDEFVMLLVDGKYEEDAALTADKIINLLAASHSIDERDLHITTSIGISIYPTDGRDAETLIKNADTAMYHAKDQGRNNFQFFRRAMNTRAVERQLIESSLRRALERQEFALQFQPKINLQTGCITGAEALLRWTHAEWGLVLPAKFVPIAEDCGLIVPIGRWVLRAACLQAKCWLDAGLTPVAIAVNISALEFSQKNFFEGVQTILLETGVPGACLELEITESVLMRDAEASAKILCELKNIGVRLAVDDFGTGYSSLSYLKQFPIDVLKIDQSFVHGISAASDNAIIVSAVIGMGNNLKLRVVAEGIETPGQLAFLKTQQCEEGQGYLFSRPVGADRFAELLEGGMPEPIEP